MLALPLWFRPMEHQSLLYILLGKDTSLVFVMPKNSIFGQLIATYIGSASSQTSHKAAEKIRQIAPRAFDHYFQKLPPESWSNYFDPLKRTNAPVVPLSQDALETRGTFEDLITERGKATGQ
jgi:hypothetical protein